MYNQREQYDEDLNKMLTEVIQNRYGTARTVTEIANDKENHRTYLIEGESLFCRYGSDPDTGVLEFVDFEGGPFVGVGGRMEHLCDGTFGEIVKVSSVEDNKVTRVEVEVKIDVREDEGE